jgi:hypothetical protein
MALAKALIKNEIGVDDDTILPVWSNEYTEMGPKALFKINGTNVYYEVGYSDFYDSFSFRSYELRKNGGYTRKDLIDISKK